MAGQQNEGRAPDRSYSRHRRQSKISGMAPILIFFNEKAYALLCVFISGLHRRNYAGSLLATIP